MTARPWPDGAPDHEEDFPLVYWMDGHQFLSWQIFTGQQYCLFDNAPIIHHHWGIE